MRGITLNIDKLGCALVLNTYLFQMVQSIFEILRANARKLNRRRVNDSVQLIEATAKYIILCSIK